ncbi:aa3-type cytochrome c oxidase subunit IV [Meridianimarinicoccus roseus]|uniref:Aa3-type cytochrome c oxidase subunit IV n=1 Tax=Meridianimarinicoccus roseus TaxID=2072018 RepID=A0A2V2LIQ9_9RHOB|nr:aa3-type cytochrome c oxidase subunit IV [Meridianimarinicoccus roseus]PWR01733.1 aa3-type cytochrome c oxidase subunit IV [Meridianimarinicoccus roseus]
MAKHEHGKMDIDTQEKTFHGFMKASAYVAAGAILLLIFIGLVNG